MFETLGTGTILGTLAIFAFLIINIIRQKKSGKMFEPATKNVFICCVLVLVAGATTANGLYHFGHGILGLSEFPAPFAKIFGNGLFSNISNVVWGLLNFAVATFITLSYRKSVPKWVFAVCYVIGFVLIALMLPLVFLPGYFQTHAF